MLSKRKEDIKLNIRPEDQRILDEQRKKEMFSDKPIARQKFQQRTPQKANLPQGEKKIQQPCARYSSSLFNTGHGKIFTSGNSAIGGGSRHTHIKKDETQTPVPWPGEDTIIVRDNRKRQM
jgi:hypothetical protein